MKDISLISEFGQEDSPTEEQIEFAQDLIIEMNENPLWYSIRKVGEVFFDFNFVVILIILTLVLILIYLFLKSREEFEDISKKLALAPFAPVILTAIVFFFFVGSRYIKTVEFAKKNQFDYLMVKQIRKHEPYTKQGNIHQRRAESLLSQLDSIDSEDPAFDSLFTLVSTEMDSAVYYLKKGDFVDLSNEDDIERARPMGNPALEETQ